MDTRAGFILGILSRQEMLMVAEWSVKVQHFVVPSPHTTHHCVLYAKLLKQHIHHLSPPPTTSHSASNLR